MNRLIVLITAVAIVLIAPAYARGFRPFVTSATAPITVAGFIGEDGSIIHGHGFTVKTTRRVTTSLSLIPESFRGAPQ